MVYFSDIKRLKDYKPFFDFIYFNIGEIFMIVLIKAHSNEERITNTLLPEIFSSVDTGYNLNWKR